MSSSTSDTKPAEEKKARKAEKKAARRGRWRRFGHVLIVLTVLLIAARAALPSVVRRIVIRAINQGPTYEGNIGDIDIQLWRGAYTIKEIRISQTTGNIPVPLFAAESVNLAVQWKSLAQGKVVAEIILNRPELNFVDSASESGDQTGAGGPWLEVITSLFPFRINTAIVHDGSVHFRAVDTTPTVDVYLSEVEATVDNLTNIYDEITPLITTVRARALAMDHARFEYEMKLDPFSYRPTFQMAVRLLGLDVTKTNALAQAYGSFDFERGWFDLVVEIDAKEGGMSGYVKPLFRNLQVVNLKKDVSQTNPLQLFWEALVGVTTEVLENQARGQFGTLIAFRGDLDNPRLNLLEIIGNVLRNAFIRAYLPRLQGTAQDIDGLRFDPGMPSDANYVGDN